MEQAGQGYGFILYRTSISNGGKLWVDECRDRCQTFVDGVVGPVVTRNDNGGSPVSIVELSCAGPWLCVHRGNCEIVCVQSFPAGKSSAVLDVLVENMGRYGVRPMSDYYRV